MKRSAHPVTLNCGTVLVWVACLLKVAAAGSNWPQWRGPDSQGVSREKNLPTEWSATKNIRWKTPIPGRGHSSPVIWNQRIFLTTAIEGPIVPGAKAVRHRVKGKDSNYVHPEGVGADRRQTLKLLCLDAKTGRLIWETTAYEGTVYDNVHKKNSFASPTPTTDGRFVYVYFGSEGLYSYDFRGHLIWKASLGGIATMGMGVASSPVLWKDLIILQCDQDNGEESFLAAVNKTNGMLVWKTHRKNRESWATPLIIRNGDRFELVTSGVEKVTAYDPASGKELWHYKGVAANAIPSPVAAADLVVLSAGGGRKRVMAIRPGGTGDLVNSSNVLWEYNKGTAHIPSPILYRDYLYLMTDAGIMTCLEAMTGKVIYEGGRVPIPATFIASPVAFDGKILLTSQDGDTFVIKAGPSHQVLSVNSLGEPICASPGIAGGRIFIRGEKHLYCIE